MTLKPIVLSDATTIPSKEELEYAYVKSYRMQTVGIDGNTIRTSVPRVIVEKAARIHGMKVKQFVKKFKVEWRFNSFDGAHALFVPIRKRRTKC